VHLRNIFLKMEVNDRTAAVRIAVHRGIIQIS
jgi:DNA-binding NarL/FixJ family response regulator